MSIHYSIIIPVYNCEQLLEKSVYSVVRQSLDTNKYEILIIDDGSTDNSLHVANRLAEKYDNIRVFQNEQNMGQGATRNFAIHEASGEYISFFDSDDMLRSDALELFAKQTTGRNKPDIVYADVLRMTAYGDKETLISRARFNGFKFKSLSDINTCIVPGAVFKRAFLIKNDIKFSEGYFHEDVVFTIDCLTSTPAAKAIPHDLYYYITRDGSTVRSFKPKSVESVVYTLETIHHILENKGLLPDDQKGWIFFSRNMVSNLYTQIITFTLPPHAEVSLAKEILCKSSLLTRHNILRGTPFQKKIFRKSFFFSKHGIREPLPSLSALEQNLSTQSILADLNFAASGAVVMIAETDYHVRNFVSIARTLNKRGIKSLICDLSVSSCFTFKRVMPDEERKSYDDVSLFQFDGKSIPPLFIDAGAYIFSIDWGHFKPVLLEARRRGIPTFAFYEGISDDFLSEPASSGKLYPYRNVDELLVPGEYYRSIYAKQRIHVVGLPIIRELLKSPVKFPTRLTAVINVNFTYSVLENKRDLFVSTAMEACKVCCVKPILSQHPADKGLYEPALISQETIYESIKSSSMIISRFSTCILEALALGKPAIYYNPHGERFPKFLTDTMGAYKIANNLTELVVAIRETILEIHRGADFREGAYNFLAYHANAHGNTSPEELAASAICDVLAADSANFEERLLHCASKNVQADF